MRHVLTRQQLDDKMWERAFSKVAQVVGISDMALRKQTLKQAFTLSGGEKTVEQWLGIRTNDRAGMIR